MTVGLLYSDLKRDLYELKSTWDHIAKLGEEYTSDEKALYLWPTFEIVLNTQIDTVLQTLSRLDKTVWFIRDELPSQLFFCILVYMRERSNEHPNPDKDPATDQLSDPIMSEIAFKVMPEQIHPGLKYITIPELKRANVTEYHPQYILDLAKAGKIEAVRIGNQWLITETGVQELLARQTLSAAGELPAGNRPGQKLTRAQK